MSTAIITIKDDPNGLVDIKLSFDKTGIDEGSAAHALGLEVLTFLMSKVRSKSEEDGDDDE